MNYNLIIADLEDRFDVKISNYIDTDYIRDYEMRNNATFCGRHIQLGPFDVEENKLIAIFHEIGHLLISRSEHLALTSFNNLTQWKTAWERLAWVHGIKAAKEMNIVFSFSAYRYAINRLHTYETYNG